MIMKRDCFNLEQLKDLDIFSLKEIFSHCAEQGTLYGHIHQEKWYHIGTVDSLNDYHALTERTG